MEIDRPQHLFSMYIYENTQALAQEINMKFQTTILPLTLVFLLSACGGSGTNETKVIPDPGGVQPIVGFPEDLQQDLPIPNNQFRNQYSVILFGNSHVSGLSDLLTAISQAALPNVEFKAQRAPNGQFLDDRLYHLPSVELITKNNWSHVILQGQKYSQSGAVDYPTLAAQSWIKLAKNFDTMPILFPEHPQIGNNNEGRLLQALHLSIAEEEASCVAPIGLAWDRVIELAPSLKLHHIDGNHAALYGSFLTSLVLFEVITGVSADLVPFINGIDIDQQTQSLLKQVASDTIAANKVCEF